jgi:hypothetical protein
MIGSGSINSERATLEGLAGMFLHEVDCANRGFALQKIAFAASLADAERRDEIVQSLGGRSRDADAILATLESQAERAGRIGIVETTITFWVEPARPGFFERIWRFLRGRPAQDFSNLYRLAPANRCARAIRFEMKIGEASQLELTATSPQASALSPLLPSGALLPPRLGSGAANHQA